MRPLESKVALVAGATRGAGRGIAVMLGEAGATVYCTGRSSRTGGPPPASGGGGPFDLSRRPETIEETAELIAARGGEGIAVRVDHTDEAQVEALIARIASDHGRLDVLVNDIWGGDHLTEWGKPFWEQTPAKGLEMVERVLRTHVITSRHAVPLMLKNRVGLVVEVTDGDFLGYRGNHFYDMAKLVPIRLAYAMAADFGSHRAPGMTALAVTPGFLRSEAMLEHFGVTEETWREAAKKDPHFAQSETPYFVGRAVGALAGDPRVHDKTGRVFASWTLAKEYGFRDVDGRQPDFGGYFDGVMARILQRGHAATDDERALVRIRYHQLELDPLRREEVDQLARFLRIP
jgi:NAD(P)-dependent dehydrogenase (short-subunit alcohol dehydrogenase family)